jgi:hypothetical protein
MVTFLPAWAHPAMAAPVLAWADAKAEPLLTRLTPENRARVTLALIALVIVGIALIALTALGGRYVLRQARKSHGPTPLGEDDWYRKPLIPRDPPSRLRDPE